jgi:rhamnosyltransferase subunit B
LRMRVLLIPVGSAGDVHPFIGIGRALKDRGHDVTMLTNGFFGPLIERVGLRFAQLGTLEEFQGALENPILWHKQKAFFLVIEYVLRLLEPMYEFIETWYRDEEGVVVGAPLAFAARVAQERLHLPMVSVALQPAMFRSMYDGPILGNFSFRASVPRPIKRLESWFVDRVIDRALGPPLNGFRAKLGLPPARGLLNDWFHSPERVLGLFPDWFGPPQPDWLPQVRLTGFPQYDERGATELPPALAEFLSAGDPPIVFTPGSAMWHGRSFFEASAAACERLGRRGMLLSRRLENVPPHLPKGVQHFEYAPFSEVLPRSAALVHHGGIGTSAQGLAAGIPQLVMPMAHDQPDNAARLQALGVAGVIKPKHYRADRVASTLRALLESPAVARSCQSIATRFENIDPLGDACRVIEAMELRKHAAEAVPIRDR